MFFFFFLWRVLPRAAGIACRHACLENRYPPSVAPIDVAAGCGPKPSKDTISLRTPEHSRRTDVSHGNRVLRTAVLRCGRGVSNNPRHCFFCRFFSPPAFISCGGACRTSTGEEWDNTPVAIYMPVGGQSVVKLWLSTERERIES